jgi:hypothetical protein
MVLQGVTRQFVHPHKGTLPPPASQSHTHKVSAADQEILKHFTSPGAFLLHSDSRTQAVQESSRRLHTGVERPRQTDTLHFTCTCAPVRCGAQQKNNV